MLWCQRWAHARSSVAHCCGQCWAQSRPSVACFGGQYWAHARPLVACFGGQYWAHARPLVAYFGPVLGQYKTIDSMLWSLRWAHARPSVACSEASTGPTQELILQLEKVIWAHSRHLQNICTLCPQWAHVGFHKLYGTFADGLSQQLRYLIQHGLNVQCLQRV